MPSPCPSRADVKEIHAAWVETLQLHSRATPIESEPVPPAAAKEEAELVTLGWHRKLEGLVTVVWVELPHAAPVASATTSRTSCRARTTDVPTRVSVA